MWKKEDEKKEGVLHTLISKPKSLTKDISRKNKKAKKEFKKKEGLYSLSANKEKYFDR